MSYAKISNKFIKHLRDQCYEEIYPSTRTVYFFDDDILARRLKFESWLSQKYGMTFNEFHNVLFDSDEQCDYFMRQVEEYATLVALLEDN